MENLLYIRKNQGSHPEAPAFLNTGMSLWYLFETSSFQPIEQQNYSQFSIFTQNI